MHTEDSRCVKVTINDCRENFVLQPALRFLSPRKVVLLDLQNVSLNR